MKLRFTPPPRVPLIRIRLLGMGPMLSGVVSATAWILLLLMWLLLVTSQAIVYGLVEGARSIERLWSRRGSSR